MPKRVRLYKKDLKKHRCWALLLWDRGTIKVSNATYKTREEAEDALLRWDRVVGHDNHPVYAFGVMQHYWQPRQRFERRFAIRCIEEMLALQQAERLRLAEMIDSAKKVVV